MQYKRTTQVPNLILDTWLSKLTGAELRILLFIVRQTHGWIVQKTGSRKERDRISNTQFIRRTGLSKRIISKAIQSLVTKKLIRVTDVNRTILDTALARKGKSHLYYQFDNPEHLITHPSAQTDADPEHKSVYNKTKGLKLRETKLNTANWRHISHVFYGLPL